jgi:hypothetical protein
MQEKELAQPRLNQLFIVFYGTCSFIYYTFAQEWLFTLRIRLVTLKLLELRSESIPFRSKSPYPRSKTSNYHIYRAIKLFFQHVFLSFLAEADTFGSIVLFAPSVHHDFRVLRLHHGQERESGLHS